jgi:hypothetical protein
VPFVLTVDQVGSRRSSDQVPAALRLLEGLPTLRGFERTAGDEVQGILPTADAAVTGCLLLVRDGRWSVGVGAGGVEHPLPTSTRAGRGLAFAAARAAVEAAKHRPQRLAVRGPDEETAADAEAVLTLLAAVVQRRTAAAWEALDLLASGLTMTDVAARLRVTRQAVGQRAAAALWQQEVQARPTAARLLARAEAG